MSTKPSEIDSRQNFFDKFAGAASAFVSKASFFVFSVLIVLLWLPTFFLFSSTDTWQLIINTTTTITTWILVALLQNAQYRSDNAVHRKLNAMADGIAGLMEAVAKDSSNEVAVDELKDSLKELRASIGLEERESS